MNFDIFNKSSIVFVKNNTINKLLFIVIVLALSYVKHVASRINPDARTNKLQYDSDLLPSVINLMYYIQKCCLMKQYSAFLRGKAIQSCQL